MYLFFFSTILRLADCLSVVAFGQCCTKFYVFESNLTLPSGRERHKLDTLYLSTLSLKYI